VLKTIVERAVELSGTDAGSIFYFRQELDRFELGHCERQAPGGRRHHMRPSNALRDAAIEAGLRAALIVTLLSAEARLGALVLQRRQPGEFSPAVVSLMQSSVRNRAGEHAPVQ
jgi:hypothetical protein